MYIYFIYIYMYKFTNKCHSQTTPSSERRYSRPGNVYSTLCKREAAMIQSAQTTIPPCQR